MTYTIYKAAGWHSEPDDPEIMRTDDEETAALRAGCRIDISIPGGSHKYDAYAVDNDTGEVIDRIESYQCDECGEIVAWDDDGPTGTYNGEILECAESMESYLVTWVCPACADRM